MNQILQFRTLSATKPITVCLVDDHEVARKGVRQMLCHDKRFKVVGEASDVQSGVRLLETRNPDVAIVDIRLGIGSGLDVVRAAKTVAPSTRILVLTAHDEVEYVTALMKLGAVGYLLKTTSSHDLKEAVLSAMSGRFTLSPEVAQNMISRLMENRTTPAFRFGRSERLTKRESEVLQHIGLGLRNIEIAHNMGIALKTVEVHVTHVLQNLGVNSRTKAALKAAEGQEVR